MSSARNFRAIYFWTRAFRSEAPVTECSSFRLLVPPLLCCTLKCDVRYRHVQGSYLKCFPLFQHEMYIRSFHILSEYPPVSISLFYYRKFSKISTALGNSATIIHKQRYYWGISPTPDPSKDTFRQISANK